MYNYKAIVKEVKDGDTISAEIDLGFGMSIKKIDLRYMGINCPECHSKNRLEKKAGIFVKDFLEKMILEKEVIVDTFIDKKFREKKEKFGRMLCVIHFEGKNINDLLIENKYAKPYKGEKKPEWTTEELNNILKTK
jgi:endonuclease YncB( thermonuclease family)